jgi:AraC-like DNA-binding protein
MKPLFESFEDDIEIYKRRPKHVPPHLHSFVELVYVTEGTMEIGIGQNLYHMEEGDLAVIFPGQIQHAQVFDPEKGMCTYLVAAPSYAGSISETLLSKVPVYPVIKRDSVHKDIVYSLDALYNELVDNRGVFSSEGFSNKVLYQSYISLILIRSLPFLDLAPRSDKEDGDLIYRTVLYVARNFKEQITLSSMAKDLYVSPFTLSRVFSGTFHTNFNRYLNETRLDYALSLLRFTDQTITEVYENAGFESQRTFNRFFTEKKHMSPREYRKTVRQDVEKSKEEQFVSVCGNKK